ncbi:MAG: putative ABC transport system permease protein, partial [Candidatus Paceibacteria bacterium]
NTVEGIKKQLYKNDWRPELEVSPAPGVEDAQDRLDAIGEIAGSAAFFQNEVLLSSIGPQTKKQAPVRARLLAVDASVLPRMDAYRLLAGDPLPGPDSAGMLLGAKLASRLGLEPGDPIVLSRPPHSAPRVCIDGKMQREAGTLTDIPPKLTFYVSGILAPEKLGRRAGGEIVIVEFGWGKRLFDGARTNERFWVRPGPTANIESLQAKLADSFAYDIGRSVVVGQAADERAYRNGVYMAGLLALMLGLYVIFHTLSMSLVERIREVGILHALGAGRRQVMRIFLFEAFILSGLGGLLGLIGGIGLARALLALGITTLGTGKNIDTFDIPLGVLPLAAIGVGTALLGSVFPLLRVRSASTVDALRGEKAMKGQRGAHSFHIFSTLLIAILLPSLYFMVVPIVGEASAALVGSLLLAVGVLGLLLAVPLLIPGVISGVCRLLARPLTAVFPFAGAMASHTMAANPRRIAVSSAAIALVCAAFVGLKGMTASLHGEVDQWASNAVHNKVWVRNLPKVEFQKMSRALHSLPEVIGIEAGSARTYAPFLLLGLHTSEIQSYGPLSRHPEYLDAFTNSRGIFISERVANNLGYSPGDKIPVKVGSGEVVPFTVLEVSDEYGYFPYPDERMYGVISERCLAEDFCVKTSHPNLLAVRLSDNGDPEAVQAMVREALGGQGDPKFLTSAQLALIQGEDIRNDFLLFDLILGLTALLACLGVLNGQLLSALERSKELGILHALGADRRQISGMVWLEGLFMGFFGGLLGLALGTLLTPIILRALEALSGLELNVQGAGAWNWITLAAAVVLTLGAGAYPVWQMNRTDSVRAVRTG